MLAQKNRVGTELFSDILKASSVFHSQHFTLRFKKNESDQTKCSVVVSKKVQKQAVDRNKLKRRMRAAVFPLLRKNVTLQPYALLLFAKKGAEKIDFEGMSQEIESLWLKIIN